MVELICDVCGENCYSSAFTLYVNVINKMYPRIPERIGNPLVTEADTGSFFVICNACYNKSKFPNPWIHQKWDLEKDNNEELCEEDNEETE